MRIWFVNAAAGIGCALALAACGGSTGKSNNGGVRASAAIKFSECMRTHGVPNFPDPSPGGGVQLSAGSGVNPSSPSFQGAQKACGSLLPGGGPGPSGDSETRKLAMLHLAQCMRSHGFTSFPDPTSAPPSKAPGGPPGGGIAFGGPGGFIAVPESMVQSPGFQQAAATCGFPGGGPPGAKGAKGAKVSSAGG
jgi:hypothetical protein